MSDLQDFYVHTATVETLLGENAKGKVYAAPFTVAGYHEQRQSLSRSTTGDTVLSGSTFYCAPTGSFTAGTKVTVNSVVMEVISVEQYGSAALALPDHVAVRLT